MKKLLITLCLLTIFVNSFCQMSAARKLLLSQTLNIGTSSLSIIAKDTSSTLTHIEKTIIYKDNVSYISSYVKYIYWGNKFVEPTDYDEIKTLTYGTDIYNTYYRFMATSPYRSIWTTESLIEGNKLELTKQLYFSSTNIVHIGIFADNYFDLYFNGDTLAATNRSVSPDNVYLASFHLFQIIPTIGYNTITLRGESDGSVSDALGFVVLNNSKDEVFDNPISKDNWDILWISEEYIGQTINIVTCESGYSYDDINNYCYQIIDNNNIQVGDVVSFSPIIDTGVIISPSSWTMYYGDGNSESKANILDEYTHTYTLSNIYNPYYRIVTSDGVYIIRTSVTIN